MLFRSVVKLIRPNEVVAIGSGATTTHVARRMSAECRDVTVITHSFSVATVLAANPTITVLMCPGRYNGREGMICGAETVEFLQSYNANWAILGATGITSEGFCDVEADASAVYKAMMHRAAATIAVADHNVPTTDRSKGIADPESRTQIETLEQNVREFGVPYFAMDDVRQGIVQIGRAHV